MLRLLRLINQNCRGAARLLSDAKERPLTLPERGGLQIHLLGCRSCRRYREQIEKVDQCVALTHGNKQIDNLELSPSARAEIGRALSKSV